METGAALSSGSGKFLSLLEARTSLDDNVELGFVSGFAARASAIFPLFQDAALQFGIAYTRKGMSLESPEYPWDDIRMRLDYLELSVLFRYSPASWPAVVPYIAIGPAISVLLDCVETLEEDGLGLTLDCPGNEILNVPRDFGAMASTGVSVAVSEFWSVTVSGYYNHGLSSLFTTGDVKSRAFSVVAGISIPIGCRCE